MSTHLCVGGALIENRPISISALLVAIQTEKPEADCQYQPDGPPKYQ
jgi:hypothetical protein